MDDEQKERDNRIVFGQTDCTDRQNHKSDLNIILFVRLEVESVSA